MFLIQVTVTDLVGPRRGHHWRLIRYHLELMQRSGIRGVIINWYGTRQANDFALNLEASNAIGA